MGWIRKLSLCEVNDLWGRSNDGFDVFPFELFSISESALEVLHLFLRASRNRRGQESGRDDSRDSFNPYPEPRHLVPLNRVLTLSNDGGFLGYRAPLRPPFALYRIMRRQ